MCRVNKNLENSDSNSDNLIPQPVSNIQAVFIQQKIPNPHHRNPRFIPPHIPIAADDDDFPERIRSRERLRLSSKAISIRWLSSMPCSIR